MVSIVARGVILVVGVGILTACGASGGRRTTSASTTTSRSTSLPAPSTTSSGTTSTSSTATSPAAPPPTVMNAPNCKPPTQHPYPVVLSPGTFGVTTWNLIGPQLAQLGYCVFTFGYGNSETASIAASARQLGSFVDRLLARTRASRVDIVGHSEGGMMPRYYLKFLGGTAKVDDLVALAPPNHGTLNPAAFGGALTGCVACAEQQSGSSFLTQLNAGDPTPPPVNYTVIATMYDEVVIPYTSAFLDGPSARVTNVTLQQQCPHDFVGHLGITSDPVALQWVENALTRTTGPANPDFAPSC
ncbi:MAG TPA: alpha/beta fold hydrolase [Solirubrobacteraceae bacterium]|nr:alpha/beta fold hydrolase [Solirubrobacteraceae bacterium]